MIIKARPMEERKAAKRRWTAAIWHWKVKKRARNGRKSIKT